MAGLAWKGNAFFSKTDAERAFYFLPGSEYGKGQGASCSC